MPTVDDAWEVAQAAWETISSVDIEIPFCTLDARMMQVIQCNGPYDIQFLVAVYEKKLKRNNMP